MNIQKRITAGDSASWFDEPWLDQQKSMRLTSADWTLVYLFRGPSLLSLQAVPEGDGWRTNLSMVDSAQLLPGTYIWSAYLTKQGERKSIEGGTLYITPDLQAATLASDGRSLARRALDDCEAALAKFQSSGGKVKAYSIGTRQTEFHSLSELMALRDMWQRKVNAEMTRDAIKNGRGNPRSLRVRFV